MWRHLGEVVIPFKVINWRIWNFENCGGVSFKFWNVWLLISWSKRSFCQFDNFKGMRVPQFKCVVNAMELADCIEVHGRSFHYRFEINIHLTTFIAFVISHWSILFTCVKASGGSCYPFQGKQLGFVAFIWKERKNKTSFRMSVLLD